MLSEDQMVQLADWIKAREEHKAECNTIREAATLIGPNAHRVITLHMLGGKPIMAKVSVELVD